MLRRSLPLLAAAACSLPAAGRASLPPLEEPPGLGALAPLAGDGDASKGAILSDGDDPAAKLPVRGKVKECCGYPIDLPGGFRLTFYWLAYEAEYANEDYDTDIYTREGFFLGRYPQAFVYELKLEGSGILRDGRVLNYDGDCHYGAGTCFKTLESGEYPHGRGVQNRALEPFRSVAVDPRFIPIGATIYVPEIVGMQLPDGTPHDGCLRADDQGGAIKLHKMDFFVESYFNFKFLADQLWWKLKATPHLDEPRCEYLRLHASKEFDNDLTDWVTVHSRKFRQALAARMKPKKRPVLVSTIGFRGKRRGHGQAHPAAAHVVKHVKQPVARHTAPRGQRASMHAGSKTARAQVARRNGR